MGKEVKGINNDQETFMGILLDGYIDGKFYIGNGEKVPSKKLELAPFVRLIAATKLFLNDDGTPMAENTLHKMAEEMWKKCDRVKHNEKHTNKPPYKRGGN